MNIQDYIILLEDISNEQKQEIIQIIKEQGGKIYHNSNICDYHTKYRNVGIFLNTDNEWSVISTDSYKTQNKIKITPTYFIEKFSKPKIQFNYCLKDNHENTICSV